MVYVPEDNIETVYDPSDWLRPALDTPVAWLVMTIFASRTGERSSLSYTNPCIAPLTLFCPHALRPRAGIRIAHRRSAPSSPWCKYKWPRCERRGAGCKARRRRRCRCTSSSRCNEDPDRRMPPLAATEAGPDGPPAWPRPRPRRGTAVQVPPQPEGRMGLAGLCHRPFGEGCTLSVRSPAKLSAIGVMLAQAPRSQGSGGAPYRSCAPARNRQWPGSTGTETAVGVRDRQMRVELRRRGVITGGEATGLLQNCQASSATSR